jgi:hypothetical protein
MKKHKISSNFEDKKQTFGVDLVCFESKADNCILGRSNQAL